MSIRKMKIQQGYIVYQIPAEEIVKLERQIVLAIFVIPAIKQ